MSHSPANNGGSDLRSEALASVTRANVSELWRLHNSLQAESRALDQKVGPILLAGFAELTLLGVATLHREKLLFDPTWGLVVSFVVLFSGGAIALGVVAALRVFNPSLAILDRRRGRSGEVPIGVLALSYVFYEDLRRAIHMARPPTPENKEAEYRRLLDELQYRSSTAGEERVCRDLCERIVEVGVQASQKDANVRAAVFWLFWGFTSGLFFFLATALVRTVSTP